MREEIKFGGRYFTIKRVKENNADTISISVSDPMEMLREITVEDNLLLRNTGLYRYNSRKQYVRAFNILAYLLVLKMKSMGMTNNLKFQYDELWKETNKDFTFEHYIKFMGKTKILKFDITKHNLSNLFIKMFIRYYNQLDYKKSYFKPKGKKASMHNW